MKLIVKFIPPEDNGRSVLPDLITGMYRPHLVVDGDAASTYLGIQFIRADPPIAFNTEIQTTVKLIYPKVDYSSLVSGVSFLIKEGPNTVGTGYVAL